MAIQRSVPVDWIRAKAARRDVVGAAVLGRIRCRLAGDIRFHGLLTAIPSDPPIRYVRYPTDAPQKIF
jgi:hypothetical protein